jgi:hypothetical protein
MLLSGFGISINAIRWNIDSTSLLATPRVEETIFLMANAFSFASLVFMTLAIVARLLFIRQKHIRLMGKHLTLSLKDLLEGSHCGS